MYENSKKSSSSGVDDDDAVPMTTRKGKASSATPAHSRGLRCYRAMWATRWVRWDWSMRIRF